ncbi:GNAT family N-acetyltransferase [Salipiger sp. 1_MG-2023]|uniref:GNAT family N-acetyltransferase n=1 Tax=Salipiger sp. 1_MG-2023 TaxID=3062665 RepID=UPI0026E129FC|nr:GNAT family N-acetyltransferase [Salipiger sp. 1_MG-2023]MDO6586808.1 GNAT family N-acetyltransferase [Salipiger sp. 1_MG-2023]
MIIRQARPEDAAALVALWNPWIETTAITFSTDLKTAEGVAADIAARGAAFQVAEDARQLVGLATYFPFRSGPGYRFTKEHSVILAPEARGKAAGRALMAALETAARAEGVQSLFAGVSGENPEGVAFHAALGFTEAARLPRVGNKFGRWMDLVLMQKFL